MANTKRLRKLANHLLNGDFGQRRFFFGTIHNEAMRVYCALGECVFAWPDKWYFSERQLCLPILYSEANTLEYNTIAHACAFFNITREECWALFLPESQRLIKSVKLMFLDAYASKEAVAKNIITFCNYKEKLS